MKKIEKLDLQVGDRVTYKSGYVQIMHNSQFVKQNENEDEIIKIERPRYEVVEEKKELLTEEEREFLKYYIKIRKEKMSHIILNSTSSTKELIIVPEDEENNYTNYIPTEKFLNIEANKAYTLQELGLEEN